MFTKLRNYFVSGLVIFLPMALTVYFFILTLGFLDHRIAEFIEPIMSKKYGYYYTGMNRFAIHFLCVLIWVFLIILIGVLTRHFLGKKIYDFFERLFGNLPFFKQVYPAFKEMVNFLFPRDQMASFKQVVLIEYPRKGIYSLGFLTNDAPKEVMQKTNQDLCNVFVPTSPSPLTGFTTIVPRSDLILLDMSIEGAFKFIISGGVVIPAQNNLPR